VQSSFDLVIPVRTLSLSLSRARMEKDKAVAVTDHSILSGILYFDNLSHRNDWCGVLRQLIHPMIPVTLPGLSCCPLELSRDVSLADVRGGRSSHESSYAMRFMRMHLTLNSHLPYVRPST